MVKTGKHLSVQEFLKGMITCAVKQLGKPIH